jgi:hypothetical protein
MGERQSLDDTLVSVLTNRPSSSEIIVVCPANFEDPYGLADEVRFVRVHNESTERLAWPSLANVGVHVAQGAYVNLVLPGVEVLEHWDAAAIERLQRTTRTGAVAPLMLDEREPADRQAIAGLKYAAAEPRRLRRVAATRSSDSTLPLRIDGPASWCGFFRRQDLLDLGGWDERLLAELADVDLALRLRGRGLASVCDPASCVVLRDDRAASELSHTAQTTSRTLRESEELFWRYVGHVGLRAWIGYAASCVDLTTLPGRVSGWYQRRVAWTIHDFQRSVGRRLLPAPADSRRAA